MNITEKLNSIIETKEAIKTSIKNKGVEVADTDPFASYAEKIDSIEAGEGWTDYFTSTIKGDTTITNIGWKKAMTKLPPFELEGTLACGIYRTFDGTEIDLSKMDISNAINLGSMFESCKNVKELDLSNFKTHKATNVSTMFKGCSSMTKIDLSNFVTSTCTSMDSMFESCSKLEELILPSNFVTETCNAGIHCIFKGCSSLTSLDLSGWDTKNVLYMRDIFNGCSKLENLNVSGWDLSKGPGFDKAFYNCKALVNLDLSTWDLGNLAGAAYSTSVENMFYGCTALTNLTFGTDLGKGFTATSANFLYSHLNLSSCTALTHDSLMDVINKLYDLNLTYDVANGGTLYTQKLTLGSTNLAKLTEDEIAIATNKGWTVA